MTASVLRIPRPVQMDADSKVAARFVCGHLECKGQDRCVQHIAAVLGFLAALSASG